MIHAQRASGFILLLVIFTCANAAAQDYYKSKFIRFIVGQAAGGGYDTYTRTIARHIVNHIPGNPGVTVEYNDRGREPSFGQLSLQQLQAGRLDDRQLE